MNASTKRNGDKVRKLQAKPKKGIKCIRKNILEKGRSKNRGKMTMKKRSVEGKINNTMGEKTTLKIMVFADAFFYINSNVTIW